MKNFTTIFPVLFFTLLLICHPSSYAAEDPAVSEQNRVIQNQQQFEQDTQRKNELRNMEVEKKDEVMEEKLGGEGAASKDSGKRCLSVSKITFTENKIISQAE